MTVHVTATVRSCFAALRQVCTTQHAAFSDEGRSADAASCTRQQSWLLQHSTGRGLSVTHWSTPSVLNAAACLVFSARRSEHVTPLLRDLHRLKVPERIKFHLSVLTHRCLHGTVPPYLAKTLQRTSDMSARRHLRSAATPTLVVPSTRRSTLGDRAFPVAAARTWNSLPSSLQAVQSLTTFRHRWKAELFDSSFTWMSYCTIIHSFICSSFSLISSWQMQPCVQK